MAGLVLELQRDALSATNLPSDLLRKALVVCRKLGVTDIERWVSCELNGYDGSVEIPAYREVQGQIRVKNPYHGWQPVHFEDEKLADIFTKRKIGQSIGELEENHRRASAGSTLHVPFSHEQLNKLMERMEIPLEPALHIQTSAIVGILDAVRTKILNWALELEKAGVIGDGMTFSRDERAAASTITYHHTTNIGSMTNSQLQQHSRGNISVNSGFDASALSAIVEAVRAVIASGKLSPEESREISADLQTLEVQSSSPRPKSGIIREALTSIRNVIEEAAGNVLGNEATLRIGEFLNALPK